MLFEIKPARVDKENPPSIQHSWVRLSQESWHSTRKGELLFDEMAKVIIRRGGGAGSAIEDGGVKLVTVS